ncbi:hypothetical protein [Spirosoma fluviale]|uniref:Uncharacterized protein n=1 Tax=Spirosoma fluviale TaxID=1597977 RepID=A0A286GJP4_9BACT|nr:hypothetical protein [Spirosoma fluviale]SOD95436.1 hypothetical protein SAMN06269250_4862 [Spirosoma fluviale]
MKQVVLLFLVGFCLLSGLCRGQMPPRQFPPTGYFLTDSIEIGRPFRYSLTYHHAPTVDVLFPDTAQFFAPYRVQKVAVFATQTTGDGSKAISRDSAVYTLVSFETDSVQLLRVPVRTINAVDCTAQWTLTDTVFLRSKLAQALPDSLAARSLTLATETSLAPLQQQFNYGALLIGFLGISLVVGALYLLFGNLARQQWRLYVLNRRHARFLREYTQLNERISPLTAAEIANQAVVMWKMYLEQLDPQPYSSLTTSELADRFHDERVTNALRDADQMIYGGTFTAQSQSALLVLSDVATQMYIRSRATLRPAGLQNEVNTTTATSSESASS